MNGGTRTILRVAIAIAACVLVYRGIAADAESCTTQSAMAVADRTALADAATSLALKVQADDNAGVRAASTADLNKDAASLEYLVGNTSTKLAGSLPTVDEVYVLDATDLKKNADGTAGEAQFFCSLNKTAAEVQFTIPALPPGRYGFAIVTFASAKPWRLSLLMRQESGR